MHAQAFGGELLARELEFAEAMLERDLRNNSAWNQRALCVRHELTTSYAATPGGACCRVDRSLGCPESGLECTKMQCTVCSRAVMRLWSTGGCTTWLGHGLVHGSPDLTS